MTYQGVHKKLWAILVLWIVTFTIFTGSVWNTQRQQLKQGKQAHDSLCAINERNKERVQVSKQFLKDHPNGTAGITAKVIRASIKSDESTIRILKNILNC